MPVIIWKYYEYNKGWLSAKCALEGQSDLNEMMKHLDEWQKCMYGKYK